MWYQHDNELEEILLDTCNQYTLQGDQFSLAILNNTDVPTPLEDALANLRVIEAVLRSAKNGAWV
jgi:predicted dehydrogenase